MKVRLAKKAGFCMGVKRAMELAIEATYHYQDPIYTYGPLIHNPQVLRMLEKKGIQILDRLEDRQRVLLLSGPTAFPPRKRKN